MSNPFLADLTELKKKKRNRSGSPVKPRKFAKGSNPIDLIDQDLLPGTLHKIDKDVARKRRDRGTFRGTEFHKFAVMSDGAYKDTMKEKSKSLGLLTDEEAAKWKIDKKLTNKHKAVYVNEEEKHVVTAYRGTKCDNGIINCLTGDIGTDMALAVGHEGKTSRFRKSVKEHFDTVDKYAEYNHTLTGHSLGGSIARYVQQQHPELVDEVHMFNAGAGLYTEHTLDKSVHAHHVVGDPISMFGSKQKHNVHLYKPSGINAHTLEFFL